MNTPTPRTALKATGVRRRDARCPETELAAITAERDQLRSEVERLNAIGSWSHTCIHHTDEERKAWVACPCCAIARAERAEAEVKRLGHLEAVLRSCAFDKDGTAWKTVCGWWSKKYDAVERQMSDNATRAELADAELATERARLDWVFHNCKVTRDDFTVHDREDLGVAMKEATK